MSTQVAQLLENGATTLGDSRKRVRLPVLKSIVDILTSNESLEKQNLQLIARLILKTYNYYQDAESRREAVNVVMALVQRDQCYIEFFVKSILDIGKKHSNLAVTDLLTLLVWMQKIGLFIVEKKQSVSPLAAAAVEAYMLLLSSAVSASSSEGGSHNVSHKRRILNTSLTQAKYTVTEMIKAIGVSDSQHAFIDQIVQVAIKCSSPSAAILFLGVLADATYDLQPTFPSLADHIETAAVSDNIMKYFCDDVIMSKNPPSPDSLVVFTQFYLRYFVSTKIFTDTVLPALEKAIMRSSEIGFCHLAAPLFSAKDSIDISDAFCTSKLLLHILTGFKSTKDHVRLLASTTFKGILANCVPNLLAQDACKLVDEIAKTLKSTTNADSKVILLSSFAKVPIVSDLVAHKIFDVVFPLALKEQNEGILAGLVTVCATLYDKCLENAWAIKNEPSVHSQFKAGLETAKLPLRSIWADSLGSLALRHSRAELSSVYPLILQLLQKSLAEASKAPLLTVTNRGILSSYVYIAISKLGDINTLESDLALSLLENITILTSPKVLSKLSHLEQLWCLRALITAFETFEQLDAFLHAFLFLAASQDVSHSTRLEALKALTDLIGKDTTKFTTSLAQAIVEIVQSQSQKLSESELVLDLKNLSPVLNRITQIDDKTLAAQLAVRLFVISHVPEIQLNEKWIGLLLRAKLDPNAIVKEHIRELVEIALDTLSASKLSTPIYEAACNALSELCFINPEVSEPALAKVISTDLDVQHLADIDETSLKIWQAAEGELVVDVLSGNTQKKVEDKNSKDYETRKWEESLKKELLSKAEVKKKLTREEQSLVNAQLANETLIRLQVQQVVDTFRRTFSIITELCLSVNSAGLDWYSASVFGLLELLQHQYSFELFGEDGAKTFINASQVCQDRLKPLERITGATILRLYDIKGIPQNFVEVPLLQSLSTILFRVKLMVDDWFHINGFIYIAPLITKVLEIGRVVAVRNSKKQIVTSEFADEDPEEEHLSLALSILSAQNMLEHQWIPRKPILNSVIELMKIPTKAKLAKECFLTLCQQISINFTTSDLQVLFDNVIIPDIFVKTAILQGIDAEFDLSDALTESDEIWIAMHDNDHIVSNLAVTIWEDSGFKLSRTIPERLLQHIDEPDSGMRLTIGKAIASAIEALNADDLSILGTELDALLLKFHEKEEIPPAPKDKFGLVINKYATQKDPWEARSTIAITLRTLSPLCSSEECVRKIFNFLVAEECLGDKEELVAQELLEAGTTLIADCGKNFVEVLIPIFEECLAQPDKKSKKQDRIKELVIILYGSLGRHLQPTDERLKIIFDRLLQTLDTPSEDVQYAVSECIAPLVPAFSSVLQERIDELFEKLWSGKNLAVRKGAAYGIAGLVKGAGIKSLYNNDVMRNIITVAEERKKESAREGVSLVLECLSQSLGPMFEPYVIEVLPIILKSLGDSSNQVRDATDYAARQIMKSTTSYGIKQLIPIAIRNLDDIAWRSKKGSVELLGSMAYLDPTQLSASLSTIVPEIVGVLNDSHKEVRKAADQSLKRFGEVIRNPEIQTIVPDLIKAIGDPTKYTEDALDKLIKTQFVHYIDGPSLALIIHVIHRGMRERSASTKKKACQIVGNMAILVDSTDLLPYLPSLVAELEVAMVDPVPETRSTGARALGSLVEKLGEEQFPDLIPRLMGTLNDFSKAGDRLGSAQALAEVICGLGLSKLDEMLPEILASAQSPYLHVRAGFMPLLLYLPVCFGSQFSAYLSRIIPPILQGLADTDEEIRDTALRAGRLIVKNYASKAVDLLLPELEQGLSDSSYRIRLSSVELTGDLLFQVTGISGKNEITEEQTEVNRNLVEVLGQDRRDRILAALYICRSDVTSVVRAAAIDIWKAMVANTPRTVKEIIPSLTEMLVKRLASNDDTQRTIAASTLGDVVRRVGVNALAQLLPTLEELLLSKDAGAKQGICIALTELINSANEDALATFSDTFIRIIRDALVDPIREVRASAALAFEALQAQLGKVVIDEILPYLLNMLQTGDSENALLALQDIMATKSDVIFPILIPTLLTPPLDVFKTKALSSLASVAGPALYSRLSSIINALLLAVVLTKASGTDAEIAEVEEAFDKTLLSIDDDAGVHPVMQQLMSLVKHQDPAKRAAICERLAVFFEHTSLDYSIYVSDMASQLIFYLGDKDEAVVKGVFAALSALVKAQDKSTLEQLVKPANQALTIAGVRNETLPGLALPKGPSCILPIFSHGLMYGNSEQRELSALSIAEIIDRTPADQLRPFATPITGPLIRVIGEKVSSDIKSAILAALTNLLRRIPQFLRPFIPQLQRTFVRSLSDPSNEKLRSGAVDALSLLIEFQPRVDSLVTELVAGAKSSGDQAVKNALLRAMLQVVLKGGKNMSEASKTSIMALVEEEISLVSDKSAVAYARLLGSLSLILSTEEASAILKNKILGKRGSDTELKFAILSINSFLKDAPTHVFQTGLLDEIVALIIECSKSTSPSISDNATVAIGKLMLLQGETRSPKQESSTTSEYVFELPGELKKVLVNQLCVLALSPPSSSTDTRRLSLVCLRTVARFKFADFIEPYFDVVAPLVFSCLRDPVIPIRLAAEKAFLATFDLVEDTDQKVFSTWFEQASKEPIVTLSGTTIQPRSIGDYTKRVASRLASVERERLEAGGDDEAMFSDRYEDEFEVWAVGGF